MNYWKTIILSDLHLGAAHSQPEKILKFLEENEAETWILNGDIIDGYVLKKTMAYWCSTCTKIIEKFLTIAKTSTVVYNHGNHDEFLKHIVPSFFNLYANTSIKFTRFYLHYGINGRCYYCFHGDVLDYVLVDSKLLYTIGSWSYNTVLKANRLYNYIRKIFKLPYHSFYEIMKGYIKDHAELLVAKFEDAAVGLTTEKGYDVAVCGHIHTPAVFSNYMNSGDFCQNCTCLVEDFEGKWRIYSQN
jgi:UDP-2,3-diacylglucosamine pyrophosphatase LpxH